jgi:hypothetical protein
MIQTRKHLRQLAAFVLLVWLFVAGAAVAHACATHVHVGSEDCCVSMEASSLRSEAASEAAAPIQEAQGWIPGAIHIQALVGSAPKEVRLPTPPVWDDDSGQRLHIVFLRLAL